ncbi:hypothetical protein SAMN05444421_103152 [Celeribacter marinus]|nr:hypothetical protein SAMN05444421_103152 [Celeribacter marinus]
MYTSAYTPCVCAKLPLVSGMGLIWERAARHRAPQYISCLLAKLVEGHDFSRFRWLGAFVRSIGAGGF